MSETTVRPASGGQFCGNCGAAVKTYWNSCAACGTPLEVRPVGSFEPVAEPAAVTAAETAPPAPAPPRPPEATPAAARPGGPRSWSGADGIAFEPPPPAWSPPPPPSYDPAPPSYSPPVPGYGPTAGYQAYNPPTAQYPAAPSYQSSYSPDPPTRARSGSGPWIIVTIVLVILLLGAGVFGAISATSLSSKKSDLVTRTKERDDARSQLTAAQAALGDANSTKASQSSQLAAYKACITDLNILFNSTSGTPAEAAADKQAQKDCVPLGLG
jgi:hypothetical protein